MKFAQLRSLLRAVQFAAGIFTPSKTNYHLDRVLLRSLHGRTEAYATDGNCLAYWSIASEIDGLTTGRDLLIEAGIVRTLASYSSRSTSRVLFSDKPEGSITSRFVLDPENQRDNRIEFGFIDHFLSDSPRYPKIVEHVVDPIRLWNPANASNNRIECDQGTLQDFLHTFTEPASTFYHVCGHNRTVSRAAMLPRSVRVFGEVCFNLRISNLLDWLEVLPVDAQVTGHFSTESPESVWHSSYGHRLLLFPVIRRRSSWTDSDPTEPVCVFSKM